DRLQPHPPGVLHAGGAVGAPAGLGRLDVEGLVAVFQRRMQQLQPQPGLAVEVAVDRQNLDEPARPVDPGDRAQPHVVRGLVGAQVGGLDLRGALDVVGDNIGRTLATGQDDHDDPGDHDRHGQPDHQPHHGLAPGRRPGPGFLLVLFSHHIGPKKLLSTVSRALPSALSITKVTSWRPRVSAGAVSSTGTESTCAGPASTCTRPPPPRSEIAGLADSSVTTYCWAESVLFTSLRV